MDLTLTVSANNIMGSRGGDGSPFRLVPSKTVVPIADAKDDIPTFVRWSFLLFVFTIPYELGFTSKFLSLAKITGLLFFACYIFWYLPLPSPLLHRRSPPHPHPAVWWFLSYVAIYALNGFFIIHEELLGHFFRRLFSLVQLILLLWIASKVLESEKMVRDAILTYALSAASLASGMVLKLPGFYRVGEVQLGQRVSAMGLNESDLATILALASVMLIGLFFHPVYRHLLWRILFIALMLPLVVGNVMTGSRAGMGAFILGAGTYLAPYYHSKKGRMAVYSMAILGIAAMIYIIASSPTSSERWQQTVEGEMAGRERIYPKAVNMILERPIFGWQPGDFQVELGRRLGVNVRDAHNLFLHLFMEVGIVGATPFLVGLWLCGRAAWKARSGNFGLMPLACLVVLLASTMTHTFMTRKMVWFVFALTLGSASTSAQAQPERRERFFVRQPARRGA